MLHKRASAGAHLPLPGLEPVGGEPITSVSRGQTYGYLPSRKASPAIGWCQIILLGDRGTCVNNLPRVALNSRVAGIRTHDLLIASPAPYHYATEPHIFLEDAE